MNLLALDTSTDTLFVAVQRGDAIWQHSGPGAQQSSAQLLPAIRQLMKDAGLEFKQLDAIVFGRGPGSFTGLRTACAITQGLAFAAKVPALPVDTLLAVAEEARHLHGCTEVEAGAKEFFKLGVQAAVITRGAKGCVVCTPKTTLTLNTYDTKVVDTTGSGDSFFGAFLTKLMETGKPVSEINEAELRDAADFANAAGSVCATKKGAIPALADRELIETCRASIPLLKL